MKRDMDIVRNLLLKIEALDADDIYYTEDQDECYNLRIMKDSGLVDGWVEDDGVEGLTAEITSMTWKGHELLDAIRNEGVWEKVKALCKKKGVEMTVDVIFAFAGQVLVRMIGG